MSSPTLQLRLANALIKGAFLTEDQILAAMERAHTSGMSLADLLLEEQLVTHETIGTVLSFLLRVPVVDLGQCQVQPEAVALVPEDVARYAIVLPVSVEGSFLRVVMEDPGDTQLIAILAALTKKFIKPVLSLRGGLREAIDAAYKRKA